ncbi:MAG: AsmA family protein [Rickettsiaceae bacterium]|nr:AsmA family protein [Rickettsiaceae bacterium]
MLKPLKYFTFLIITLVILLFATPFFIPIDKYKEDIITEVKKTTGRDLAIDGKISLSLLPKPYIALSNVKLSSIKGAKEPLMADIETVSVKVDIIPLFTGKVVVSAIYLDKPKINLEVLKDGSNNWTFSKIKGDKTKVIANNKAASKKKDTNNKTAKADNTTNIAKEKASDLDDLPFIIKNLSITNGKISYIDKKSRTDVEDIDIHVDIDSWHGPVDFKIGLQAFHDEFKLTGTIKEIGEIIPIEAKLATLHDNLNIVGKLDTKKLEFAGGINADGELEGIKDPFNLSAKLQANKNNVLIQDILFTLGKLEAKGEAKHNIVKNISTLKLAMNPGQISLSLSKNNIFSLKVKSLQPILTALNIDNKDLPPIINQPFTLSSMIKPDGKNITLEKINFTHKNASVKGDITINKQPDGIDTTYNLTSSNSKTLLSLLSKNADINLGTVKLTGNTNQNNGIITTDTKINTLGTDIAVKGEVDVSAAFVNISLLTKISGNNLSKTLGRLANNKPNKLGKFSLVNEIKGEFNKKIRIKTLESMVNIGKNKTLLRGDTEVTLNAAKPRILANLVVDNINLDDFAAIKVSGTKIAATSNSSKQIAKGKVTPAVYNTTIPASANVSNPGNRRSTAGGTWSREKIDLSFLDLVNGEVNIKISKFVQDALEFEHMIANLLLSNSTLELKSLTADLYGGQLTANGKISNQAGRHFNLKAAVKQANLKNLKLSEFKFKKKKLKITEGVVNVNIDLKSSGASEYEYVSNLFGNVDIDSQNGTLQGVDLGKVAGTFGNIKDLPSTLANLKSAFAGGNTKYQKLIGVMKFSNGISSNSRFKLKSDVVEMDANGTIDLPGYQLNILAEINSSIKDVPTFKVKLYGPLNNPQRKFDFSELQKYIAKNFTKDIKDKVLKNIGGGDKKKALKKLKNLFK